MPDGDMEIKTEDLKAQLPALQDLGIGLTQIQSYLHNAKAQPNHFGQTPNAGAAGTFSRTSIDNISQSVGDAQQYLASVIQAVQGTVGQVNQNESTTKQNFDNKAV
jgi:hypothetical protein